MRTQQQTIIMYGFLVACIMTLVSLVVPAYYIEYGGGVLGNVTETVRLVSSYISWPIAIAALGGIAVVLFKYSKRNVLISGGLQVAGLVYQIYKTFSVESALRNADTTLGKLSEVYELIGGGNGINIRLGAGFALIIIAAALVAAFTLLCNFLVEEY